jgi:hypothetical protein
MLNSKLYTKSHDTLASLGGNIGLVSNRFDNYKLGLKYSYDKYNKSITNKEFETFLTYKFLRNTSVNLNYTNDNLHEKRDKLSFGLFYYF